MRKMFKILRRVVVSCFLLYGYNLLAQPLGTIVPINVITISAITILGLPALVSLILILVYSY